MADYSTIKGFTIQSLATDPYTQAALGGTWASGGALNTARQGMGAAIGAPGLTAGLCFGGNGPPDIDATEKYDGTTWTEVGNMLTARGSLSGCGIQTAALAIGGEVSTPSWANSDYTEEFDGTSWSETGDLAIALRAGAAAGTITAGLRFGGLEPPGAEGETETFNGTTWTEVSDLNTARYSIAGGGTQTAALCIGGTPALTTVESWDGTSWTQAPVMTIGKNGAMAAGGAGIQTAGLAFGSSQSQVTESFNGIAWAAGNSSATKHDAGGGSGSPSSAALMFGGGTPSDTDATEQYSPDATATAQEGQVWYNTTSKVLKAFGAQGTGAWASGDNLNTPRGNNMGMTTGIATAALTFGGHETTLKDATETYDGTSWTETGHAMNTARYNGGSQGTQTATVCFGGGTPGSVTNVELYNGSTWTDSTAMPTAAYGLAPAGSSNIAALAISGVNPPSTHVTEAFELTGTSWTEIASVTTGRQSGSAAGTVTAALFVCGSTGAPLYARDLVESFNGTSWTASTATPADRYGIPSFGTQTACMTAGGAGPPGASLTTTLSWDGSSWTELADLATARYSNATARGGTSTSGLYVGSAASPYQATEEWSVPDAIKTFTAT